MLLALLSSALHTVAKSSDSAHGGWLSYGTDTTPEFKKRMRSMVDMSTHWLTGNIELIAGFATFELL